MPLCQLEFPLCRRSADDVPVPRLHPGRLAGAMLAGLAGGQHRGFDTKRHCYIAVAAAGPARSLAWGARSPKKQALPVLILGFK